MESEKGVKALLVIEVMGKPAEHIDQAIHDLVERLGKEQDVDILNKKFYEPKPTETLFITFCEVEIAVPSLSKLSEIGFNYMPSSIEIFEPSDLRFNINDANSLINGIIVRLHQYDAIAKRITFENMILKNQLQQVGAIPAVPSVPDKKQESKSKKKSKKAGNSKAKKKK